MEVPPHFITAHSANGWQYTHPRTHVRKDTRGTYASTRAHGYLATTFKGAKCSNENKMSQDKRACKPLQEPPVVELADGVLMIEVLPSGLLVPSDMQVPVIGTVAYEPGLA